MTLVSQAEFSRLKNVSRKTVTDWKKEERIVMVDGKVDVEASQEKLLRNSRRRAKGRRAALSPATAADAQVTGPDCAPLADYPASMAVMTTGGASDLAVILLRHGLPRDRVEAIVEEWLAAARRSATALLEDDQEPPAPFEGWADHPAFVEDWLSGTSWEELEGEAAQPRAEGWR
jgi:hypothetical protein